MGVTVNPIECATHNNIDGHINMDGFLGLAPNNFDSESPAQEAWLSYIWPFLSGSSLLPPSRLLAPPANITPQNQSLP